MTAVHDNNEWQSTATNNNNYDEGQWHMTAARDDNKQQTTSMKDNNDDEGWRRMTAARDGDKRLRRMITMMIKAGIVWWGRVMTTNDCDER